VDSIAEYFLLKTVVNQISKTRCEIAGVSDVTNDQSDQRVIVNQWISE